MLTDCFIIAQIVKIKQEFNLREIAMLSLDDKSFYKKLPAFNLVAEMNELCLPLFRVIGANYFDYNRVYNDNSFLTLTSDASWLEHFFKRKYKLCTALKRSGAHLWEAYYYQSPTLDAKVNFNHDHGITIINKQDNYVEYVDIAAPTSHREITSFYLNNFDYIENFISEFMDKSANLIAIAEKSLIQLPNVLCCPKDDKSNLWIQDILISNREKQCLELYLTGNTAKETAKILQLSHRTVEEYINNLKNKLGCLNKRELLKIFNNSLA